MQWRSSSEGGQLARASGRPSLPLLGWAQGHTRVSTSPRERVGSHYSHMWNDTETPIAYFVSFRTYGTWLHGDERGSIDRFNNAYQTPYIEPNQNWLRYNEELLKSPPFKLNAIARKHVEAAIREVCAYRNWYLYALNVRTNHAHSVVDATGHSSKAVLNSFKAYGTRRLREQGCWTYDHSPWADKGSRRKIWNERGLQAVIDYVVNGQGGPLPEMD